MRKSDLLRKKAVKIDSKHLDYNIEILDNSTLRYSIVVVGFPSDKNQILNQFLKQITKISPLEDYQEITRGKVKGGPLEYQCVSFSANVNPQEININEIDFPLVKDSNLREKRRTGRTLELYVDNKYS